MTRHPLNANRKIYPIGMQEKHNKGLFFMVRFHRNFTIRHLQEKMSVFPASQFFPRPLAAAVITYSPLTVSPWVAEAKRRKNVSAQSQLISASRNTHKRHISLIPEFPVQTHCSSSPVHALQYEHVESLTVSIPSGENFSVTMPCLYPNPPDLCSELPHAEQHSIPRGTKREAVGSHCPIFSFTQRFSCLLHCPWGGMPWDATGCLATHH